MAIAFRLRVQGLAETERYFRRVGRTFPRRAIPNALVEIGLRVQREAAQNQIIRGGPRGAPANPYRLTSRTGTLRRSIRVNRGGLPSYVDVGSDLQYARIHELGGRTGRGGLMPARPYLKPALEEIARSGVVRSVMNKHLRREIERTP